MIKRYTPDCSIHMNHEMAFMRELAGGEYVKYSDHQQILAAVVAENAALKDVRCWNFKTGAGAFEQARTAGCDLDDCIHDVVQVMLCKFETPSTDAALAAIQAQSVEDAVKQVLSVDTIASTAVISHLLRVYATELREGQQNAIK
ncbi:Uncharacterised protein [Serratia rubidaea]|nr:Uncharacterised protein [Serratia rubidaea]